MYLSDTWDAWLIGVVLQITGVNAAISFSWDRSTELEISFAAEFELPGDYYEFTVDAVNEGSIDAKLDNFTSNLSPNSEAIGYQTKCFVYGLFI